MQFLGLSILILSAFWTGDFISVLVWHNTEQHCWTFILCYWAMLRFGVDSVPQNTNSRSSSAYRWFGSQLWSVQSTHWLAQCIPPICNSGYGYGCLLSLCSARWQTQLRTVSSGCCLGATGSGSHQQERLGGIAPSTNSIWLVWREVLWCPETLSKKLLKGNFHFLLLLFICFSLFSSF